jgi:hypothetical protein
MIAENVPRRTCQDERGDIRQTSSKEHSTMTSDNKEQHEKPITIIVNGRQKTVTEKALTFFEVVALAFDTTPTGDTVEITVNYTRGHGEKPEGSLTAGHDVKVKEGMIFNVSATNRS